MTFADLPDVLLIDEVADLMRLSRRSIYNAMYAGTFVPVPFAERPYRWRKEDLEAWRDGKFRDAHETLRANRRRKQKATPQAVGA